MAGVSTATVFGPFNLLKGNGQVPGYDRVVTGPDAPDPGRIQVDKAAANPNQSQWT